MSRSIWTRCAASFKPRALSLEAHRVVESQHLIATRKLVDSDAEQAVLEDLIERVKPPPQAEPAFRGLHYLLFTPFRHPPLRHGSRFGTRIERGIWYGSADLPTALAEVAYYRLLFLEGSEASLAPLTNALTSFAVRVRARVGVDLTRPPFAAFERALASKTSYAATQALGTEMRGAGVEAFVFRSARASGGRKNVGLFSPCFAAKRPSRMCEWLCTTDHEKVELVERTFARTSARRSTFARSGFLVGGRLPAPGAAP